MENKKFELCSDVKQWSDNIVLYRIKALKDFICDGILIRKGDKGGFVQSENNLSQEGNCWVFDDSIVFENAKVYDNAIIKGYSIVQNNSIVS